VILAVRKVGTPVDTPRHQLLPPQRQSTLIPMHCGVASALSALIAGSARPCIRCGAIV